jgi:hypothetical protein
VYGLLLLWFGMTETRPREAVLPEPTSAEGSSMPVR